MKRLKHLLHNRADASYALEKALGPFLRGFIWQLLHFRRPRVLFLGGNIRFICSGNIDFGRSVSIGANSYVETCSTNRCRFGDRVTLRENVWVQCRSGLNPRGAGLTIGNNSYIGPGAIIGVGGPITIGEGCQIGARLSLSAEEHADSGGDYTAGKVVRKGILIGDHTWIGNNVTILDGVEIGPYCVIGAGAVVTKSLPPRSKAVGVPARVIAQIAETTSDANAVDESQ